MLSLSARFGTSEQVELFAAVVGFALVGVQAGGMLYSYRSQPAKETSTGAAREVEWVEADDGKAEAETELANPVAADANSDTI